MVFVEIPDQVVHQFRKEAVVAGAQGAQGHLLIAGAVDHAAGVLLQLLFRPLAQRPVDRAGLAEAAAADAAALDLQHHAVLGHLDIGNERLLRIGRRREIRADLAPHFCRDIRILRREGGQGPVFVVRHLIKGRHVDPRQRCGKTQERLPAGAFLLLLRVQIDEGVHFIFRFSDQEEIEERGDRLRIVGARSSSDDQRIRLRPVFGIDRNARQIEDLQDIRIA